MSTKKKKGKETNVNVWEENAHNIGPLTSSSNPSLGVLGLGRNM